MNNLLFLKYFFMYFCVIYLKIVINKLIASRSRFPKSTYDFPTAFIHMDTFKSGLLCVKHQKSSDFLREFFFVFLDIKSWLLNLLDRVGLKTGHNASEILAVPRRKVSRENEIVELVVQCCLRISGGYF